MSEAQRRVGEHMSDLHIFDIATREWRLVPRRGEWPESRYYHTAFVHDGSLVVAGGCGNERDLDSVWEYDTEGETWTRLRDLPYPMRLVRGVSVAGVPHIFSIYRSDTARYTVDHFSAPHIGSDLTHSPWVKETPTPFKGYL
ncbi:hypothetical protein KIPB_011499, partial [Kipferlia bialata]|eukprot:g11499.t1